MMDPNTSDLLKSLEAHYLEGNYQKVLSELYQNASILDAGVLYYNLGTVYARMGELASGRYYLEKSILSGNVSTEVQNNLNFVTERLGHYDLASSNETLDGLFSFLLSVPQSAFWAVTLFFLALALTWGFYHKKPFAKLSLVLMFSAVIPIAASYYFSSFETAINIEEVALREGPSGIYEQRHVLQPGAKLLLGRYYNGWYFIERPKELSGWVDASSLGLLRSNELLEAF